MKVRLYHNPDEHNEENEKFGALVASEYKGNNPVILKLQRVLQYLEKRRQRKAEKVRHEKYLALIAEGEVEKAEKLVKKRVPSEKIILGELYAVKGENSYMFETVNGERFRIPEPNTENGLYDVFEYEFKRVEA